MIQEKQKNFLQTSAEIQNVKVVMTDREKVLFSYPDNKVGLKITDNVKKIMERNKEITMEENVFNKGTYNFLTRKFEKGNIKELFQEDNIYIEDYTAQMIVPICLNGEVVGSIIYYRDIYMNYPGKDFVKSKLKSIILAKKFLEGKFL